MLNRQRCYDSSEAGGTWGLWELSYRKTGPIDTFELDLQECKRFGWMGRRGQDISGQGLCGDLVEG